ncbi:aldehyde dehydrogenase family protein [Salmonella enterica subsp. enterica serovar Weltevreden]|nr:aldehyde dehydrogenase family protein [Salmonella enterica subsp. enterica serovar Weltevreden]
MKSLASITAGVNVVNGAGGGDGEYLATRNAGIAKVAFTGSTEVGQQTGAVRHAEHYSGDAGVSGKSPNIFFADVMDEEDAL